MTQIGGGAGPRPPPAQHLDAQIAVLFPPLIWPKKPAIVGVVKRNYTRFWQRREMETRVAKRCAHVAVLIY